MGHEAALGGGDQGGGGRGFGASSGSGPGASCHPRIEASANLFGGKSQLPPLG